MQNDQGKRTKKEEKTMKLSEFIASLEGHKERCGDIEIAMYDRKTGGFGSFCAILMDHEKGDFLGFISDADMKDYMGKDLSDLTDDEIEHEDQ
jgi:hypothetical protein